MRDFDFSGRGNQGEITVLTSTKRAVLMHTTRILLLMSLTKPGRRDILYAAPVMS